MNTNTIIGAVIAALILFLSSLVTLFVENSELTFAMIKQSTWVSIIGGAIIAFLKDYQALSTRRVINKVTHSGDGGGTITKSSTLVGLLSGLLVMAMLAGCAWSGVQRPDIHSTSDAIVVAAADIESVADQIREACGNTEPGGPCVSGALVSTSQKEEWKDWLQEAQDSLDLANQALAIADHSTAETKLAAAESILRIVRAELARRTQ